MKHPIATFAAAAGLFLVAAGPAAAAAPPDQPEPFITGLSQEEGPPGTALGIEGNNFTDQIAEITVTVGSSPAQVLEARADFIRVLVSPFADPGRARVRVTIGRERSNEVNFTIISLEDWEERRERDAQTEAGGASGLSAERQYHDDAQARLELACELVATSGTSRQIDIRAQARFPDTASIYVTFRYGEREIETRRVQVRQNAFALTFGPYDKPFLSGLYAIEAVFDLGRNPHVRRELLANIPRDYHGEYQMIRERAFVEIGDADSVRTEDEEIRAHYRRLFGSLDELMGDLQRTYAATAKCLFRDENNGSFNFDDWRAWLRRNRLGGDDQYMELLNADRRFLTSDCRLDPDGWLGWLEGDFLSVYRNLYEQHRDFMDRCVALRYPVEARDCQQMLAILIRLALQYSRDFYRASGIEELPVILSGGADLGGIMGQNPAQVDVSYYAQLEARITRRLSLDGDPERGGEGE